MPPAPTLDAAIALHRNGELEQAQRAYQALLRREPRNADAMGLLGVVESQLGRHRQATELLRKASRLSPRNPVILTNFGEALSKAGAHVEAEHVLRQALRVDASLFEAQRSLANVLTEVGRTEEAIDAFRNASQLRDDPETWFRLGTLLLETARHSEAGEALERALQLDVTHLGAWQNLAALAYRSGDPAAAEACYQRVLDIEPTHVAALQGLAQVRKDRGDAGAAIGLLWEAIRQDMDNDGAWVVFAETLGQTQLDDQVETESIERILEACLQHPAVNPQSIAGQAVRLLRRIPETAQLIDLAEHDPSALDQALDGPEAWAVLSRSLIELALDGVVLPDLGLEALLKAMRRTALFALQAGEGGHPALARPSLHSALARQSFLNGYLWSFGPDEVAAVETLVANMAERALGTGVADALAVQALASYVPLLEWDRVEEVVALAGSLQDAGLMRLVQQQVLEPLEEMEVWETLPSRGTSSDAVSEQVRAMYEEYPYPRWTRASRYRTRPLHAVLAEVFPGQDFAEYAALTQPRILVAGCGTGLHLLEVCRRYADAEVTGIDLSRASLAFASRKLREAQIDDVTLLHADILSLADWAETYDVIESVGVLHHMADPVAGWAVLTDRLRPGGLMRVGLYSEHARASVAKARAFIEREGFPGDVEGIRAAREALIAADDPELEPLRRWRDFYSLQEVRDLVFHVQEHRFTLPKVQEALEQLGLEFLGFDLRTTGLLRSFRARFPEPGAESDLGAWARYEEENPAAFAAMYQFWVRKRTA